MPKNIVVLSDGTGQEGGRGHDTNIYKLFRMLEDRTPRQVVFYDQGLGTDWHKVTGNAFGVGFSKNILQCYRFIYDNYEAGDKIFLLGFSRGAATVRSLANFIHYFGILPKARPELIRRAWKIYKRGRQERPESLQQIREDPGLLRRMADRGFDLLDRTTDRVDAFLRSPLNERAAQFVREHPNQWVSIEFLGVYDTVPALGLIPLAGLNVLINNIPWWRHQFHDFRLHESVHNAYHALAIDDDRLWFHPTIWKECAEHQTVEQVWFPGSHTDVGGGFTEAGMSDVALEWMVGKAVSHGIRLYLGSRKYWNFAIAPDPTDLYHPPRAGIGRIYAYAERDKVWDRAAFASYGPPKLHRSVLDRAANDPHYRPWILKKYQTYLLLLAGQFADWLKAEYDKEYDRLFDAYVEALMAGETPETEPPADRTTWQAENPFEAWLEKHHSGYKAQLQKVKDDAELFHWLQNYAPFQQWLSATYPTLEPTELGLVHVEPYSDFYEYEDEEGVRWYTAKEYDKRTQKKRGIRNFKPVQFRDYDQASLKKMIDAGLDTSPRGAFNNLLERVISKKKKATHNRYLYDRKRWYGS